VGTFIKSKVSFLSMAIINHHLVNSNTHNLLYSNLLLRKLIKPVVNYQMLRLLYSNLLLQTMIIYCSKRKVHSWVSLLKLTTATERYWTLLRCKQESREGLELDHSCKHKAGILCLSQPLLGILQRVLQKALQSNLNFNLQINKRSCSR
jgi:hypothetical protein